jgi:hypothetical protein
MRNIVIFLAALTPLALWSDSPTRAAEDDATKAFFNGKDLEGWEGLIDQFWSVKDGAIVGTNGDKKVPFNTFLCSKKNYKDFELTFQIRLKDGEGNSGVQIRSKIFNREKFAVSGPQADIGQIFWGTLYGEHFSPDGKAESGFMKQADPKLVKKVLKPKDFNDYYIKCVGKHVTIKLNGETTVDDDFPRMTDEGIIAWQLHGDHVMEVTFKNIKFKDLSAK